MAIWQGFALGLSNGVFCLASCAPALVPTLLSEEREERWVPWGHMAKFLTGRLLAYLLVGWAAGAVGMHWGQDLPGWIFGLTWVLLGGLLIGQALLGRLGPHLALPFWRRVGGALVASPFVFGILLGLAPCVPFGLALAAALERGRPGEGVLFFAAFFVSTSLFLLPLGFLGRLARHAAVRQVARWTAVLVGIGFFLLGLQRMLG